MRTRILTISNLFKLLSISLIILGLSSCTYSDQENLAKVQDSTIQSEKPTYFYLRPNIEKMYGYTQAVKVGNIVKIGGVISIDENGKPLSEGDYLGQMKNCYASLSKILAHYGCTFDDVYLENIYTTSMAELQKNAQYRGEIYKNQFPTGSWIGIKELGLPQSMIEIEMEALIPQKKAHPTHD